MTVRWASHGCLSHDRHWAECRAYFSKLDVTRVIFMSLLKIWKTGKWCEIFSSIIPEIKIFSISFVIKLSIHEGLQPGFT